MTHPQHGLFTSATVIANPAAGGVSTALVEELTALCRRHVCTVVTRYTRAPRDATRLAADALATGTGVVIAVGGDGTVREVVEGLHGARTTAPPLLIVPAGTGNSSFLAMWGRVGWEYAVTAALTGDGGALRALDLAVIEQTGELVLLGACSGLIADALVTARSVPVAGRERYRIALAETAADFAPYPGTVEVDGVTVHRGRTVLANVGGGRHRGGTYQVLPESVLDDGLLDVCVLGDVDPVAVPALIREGDHVGRPGVTCARGSRITVTRTDGGPLSYEHDGELCTGTATAITVRVLPGALSVLCRAELPGLTSMRP